MAAIGTDAVSCTLHGGSAAEGDELGRCLMGSVQVRREAPGSMSHTEED